MNNGNSNSNTEPTCSGAWCWGLRKKTAKNGNRNANRFTSRKGRSGSPINKGSAAAASRKAAAANRLAAYREALKNNNSNNNNNQVMSRSNRYALLKKWTNKSNERRKEANRHNVENWIKRERNRLAAETEAAKAAKALKNRLRLPNNWK